MKTLLAVALAALSASAQVTASFSPQPLASFRAAFGSKVRGVAIYDVQVCSKAAADVAAGVVMQAAQTKFSTVNAVLNDATVRQARSANKWVKASRILEVLSGLATIFGVSGAFQVGKGALTVLASLPPVAHELQGYFEGQAPPPAGAYSGSMLQGLIHVAPNSCEGRLLLGEYVKGLKPFQVVIP